VCSRSHHTHTCTARAQAPAPAVSALQTGVGSAPQDKSGRPSAARWPSSCAATSTALRSALAAAAVFLGGGDVVWHAGQSRALKHTWRRARCTAETHHSLAGSGACVSTCSGRAHAPSEPACRAPAAPDVDKVVRGPLRAAPALGGQVGAHDVEQRELVALGRDELGARARDRISLAPGGGWCVEQAWLRACSACARSSARRRRGII
jgi:hypothetical protein